MRQPSEHLQAKIFDAGRIVADALNEHMDGRELVGKVVLYSGGNDSTALTHLFRDWATHAAHANTTIGIERTRQFVRSTCADWGLPLLERSGPDSYRDLVLEAGSFPGPAMHFKMYQRLKEKALREVRRELVKNGRKQRVLFIAGRRRAESDRRANIPEHERIDSVVWASPLAHWTKEDLAEYRETFGVPESPIAKALGMSGECLCGAFAEPGEFERIAAVDSDAAELIRSIERDLHYLHSERRRHGLSVANALRIDAAQMYDEEGRTALPSEAEAMLAEAAELEAVPEEPGPRCKWGWGAYRSDPDGQPSKTGPLCSSCDARFTPVADAETQAEANGIIERIRARRTA